jgi:cullin 3
MAFAFVLGQSVSDDAKRGMFTNLTVKAGYQFMQEVDSEGTFNDMKISSDGVPAYRKHLLTTTVSLLSEHSMIYAHGRTQAPDIELSVIVMTSTYWPMSHACHLPDRMIKATK